MPKNKDRIAALEAKVEELHTRLQYLQSMISLINLQVPNPAIPPISIIPRIPIGPTYIGDPIPAGNVWTSNSRVETINAKDFVEKSNNR